MVAFDIDGVMVEFVREIFMPTAEVAIGKSISVVSPESYPFTEQ